MRSAEDLTKLVNQSGFPLQLAIEHLIATQALGWRVQSQEHGWKAADGQGGFIDLVLEDRHQSSVLVLECKRVLEADWIFLSASDAAKSTPRSRLWISNTVGHGKPYFGYLDVLSNPESLEAPFCVVPGQDAKGRPMLERIAGEVAVAMEALALEERPLMERRSYGVRMYGCAVVTTARLLACSADISKVALATGELQDASFKKVPWIRFRKAFSSELAVVPPNPAWDFSSLATSKEKSVLVVNALALDEFLRQWSVVPQSLDALM